MELNSWSSVTPEANKFKYQQKERDLETGYDYDVYPELSRRKARLYDSGLGRFMQVDPMAEKYLSLNPFVGMGVIANVCASKEDRIVAQKIQVVIINKNTINFVSKGHQSYFGNPTSRPTFKTMRKKLFNGNSERFIKYIKYLNFNVFGRRFK